MAPPIMPRATVLALALPLLLSLAACSGSNQATDTPTNDTSFQATVPEGTPVYVNRGGQWLPASVVKQTGAATVLIHYEGAPSAYDEDVPFDRVRSRPVGPSAAEAPQADFTNGEHVIVSAQNRLLLAEVTQSVGNNTYRVHYAGYGPDVVENVTADRIHRPFAGATAHAVGEAVTVDVGAAQPMPGKVLAVVAADQWLVRLDNAGPQYDQQVGADRIHAMQAAPAGTTPPAVAPSAPPSGSASPAAGKGAPAAGKGAPAAPQASAPLKVGDAVLLKERTVYYAGKIVGNGASGSTWKVRVEGQSADEEVPAASLMRLNDPLKGVKYQSGQEVYVEYHGVWVPGKVGKEADSGNYRVKVGDTDEIINVKRIRPR